MNPIPLKVTPPVKHGIDKTEESDYGGPMKGASPVTVNNSKKKESNYGGFLKKGKQNKKK